MSLSTFKSLAISFSVAVWLLPCAAGVSFAQRTIIQRGDVRAGSPGGVVPGATGGVGRVGESKVGDVPSGGGRGTGGGAGVGGGSGQMMGGRVGSGFQSSAERSGNSVGGGTRGLHRAADRYDRDWSGERPTGNLTRRDDPAYDEVIGDRVYLRGEDRRSYPAVDEYADDLGLRNSDRAAVRAVGTRDQYERIDSRAEGVGVGSDRVQVIDGVVDRPARTVDRERYVVDGGADDDYRAGGLDRAVDRSDTNGDRFVERVDRTNRELANAYDRVSTNRDRFDDRRASTREDVEYRERDRTSRSYSDRDRRTSDEYDARRDDRYERDQRDERSPSNARERSNEREWFDDREDRTARRDSGRRYSDRDDRTRTQESSDNRTQRRTSRTADRVDRSDDRSAD